MKLTIECGDGATVMEVEGTEPSIFEAAGLWLREQDVPCSFTLRCPYGSAGYRLDVRRPEDAGSRDVNDMHVVETSFDMEGLPAGEYAEAYLTCVEAAANRYKFYRLTPGKDGIRVRYGRIGDYEREVGRPYASRLYWLLVAEKAMKGYVDNSEAYLSPKAAPKGSGACPPPAPDTPGGRLFAKLLGFAKGRVERSLRNADVTVEQAIKSRKLLTGLGAARGVGEFNDRLLGLLGVSPRRVPGFKDRGVRSLLAKDEGDFARIIQREEDLVLAMEAVAGASAPEAGDGPRSFEDLGIEVHEATDSQRAEVRRALGRDLAGRPFRAYRVINPAHRKRFEGYLEANGIDEVKRLWHGSRNENWLSIVENGLLLNPNAVITGKMFGDGIYFAPSSKKSWNYTSFRGTYWARGTSSTGIMGLYATAYGSPLDVTAPGAHSAGSLKRMGRDCVHAHAGDHLLNDEIVYYDEAAVLLQYLVVFE